MSKVSLVLATLLGMLGTVVPLSPVLAVGEGLVVNEIDYDQASTDAAEFVEIYNTSTEAVELTGLQVQFVNGNGGAVYDTIALSGELGAGDFLVVCANAATTPNCDFDDGPETNFIQNGSPDAVAVTRSDGSIIDTVSYEGDTTGYTEGTGTNAADNNDPFVGLSRRPNGADTGDNAADFALACITPGTANSSASSDCPDPAPPPPPPDPEELEIYEVQGPGDASPHEGDVVTIDGVVVGDFQGNEFAGDQLGGFHLQEAEGDDNPDTSDGIFVFAPDAPDVEIGNVVEVTGTVDEFFGLTEITDVTSVSVTGTADAITPTEVTVPSDLEPVEGMLVTFSQDLYISEFFNYDRFGEIVLTTTRQYQGTQVAEPGAAANAVAEANEVNRITLDDGRTSSNPDPALHPNGEEFTLENTFRGGDILRDVTGVVDFSFGAFKIQPTSGATHLEENPRPTTPDPIGGQVRVATFNVLNFFIHIDRNPNTDSDEDNICGPTRNLECRGANTEVERQRQLDKLVAGIIALDADVVGIQEIENDIYHDDGNRAHDPVLTLVEALNADEGEGTWAWVGPADHYNDYPVRNEIIYRTDAVTPVGDPDALAHEAFDKKRPGDIEPVGRPPLAQTFRQIVDRGSRQPFTVVVNHFKSKGSDCESLGDPDTGDGQANCNLTRVAQSEALLDFIDELEENSSGVLAIGDFNSYAMEDPIDTLEDGGLIDLVGRAEGPTGYSYLFDGQLGTLDYIFATRSMLNRAEGVTVFHINADEPDILDYDMSFKKDAQDALYERKPYRVSDHDPIIVGLSFGGPRSR